MKYKDIKNFGQRCKTHPDHRLGMVTNDMIARRLEDEIDELRAYIESRQWVGLTAVELGAIVNADIEDGEPRDIYTYGDGVAWAVEAKLKEKNT